MLPAKNLAVEVLRIRETKTPLIIAQGLAAKGA
jgi:hypothetical protein